jgi:glycosyltransferase involved in cell wall biosynthesis
MKHKIAAGGPTGRLPSRHRLEAMCYNLPGFSEVGELVRIGIDARLVYYQRAGIASYILGLLHGLAASDAKDEFLVLRSRRDREDFRLPPNFHRRSTWTPCHHRFERQALAVELLGTGLDLLHSTDFIPPARLFNQRRSVITVHDLAYLKYPEVLTPASQRYYGQIGPAVDEADAVIAVSENTKRDLMAFLDAPEEKIVVIPEAPDPIYQPNASPESIADLKRRYSLGDSYFLFVGTIEPKKNLKTLVEAYGQFRRMARASEDLPDLVVVGRKGWLFTDVFDLVNRLSLNDSVRFLGPVPREDLPAFYGGALALTYPSIYEGFGLPILEAMASGTPVVTSNVSSLPEVAGEAAICVDPRSVDGLAEALHRVWSSPETRGDLKRKGLARARLFSWEKTARQTLDVYDRVVRLGRPHA